MNTLGRDNWKTALIHSTLIFLVSVVALGWSMGRVLNPYDEGIILTGAMRVAAGEVPHRDFYANYGPAQFYLLAGLFKLFGHSALVERAFDLVIRSATVAVCYAITATHARSAIALACAVVCALWLFVVAKHGSPLFPVIPITLMGTALAAPALGGGASRRRLAAAGAAFGVATLFRYDVGLAAFLALAAAIAVAGAARHGGRGRLRAALAPLMPYALGGSAVLAPVVLCYLAVAPVAPFVHDVILYPAVDYARMRGLPFPAVHAEPVVYLPPLICAAAAYGLLAETWNTPAADASRDRHDATRWLLVSLIVLTVVLYAKGFVRISTTQIIAAIITSAVLLAVLAQRAVQKGRYKLVACLVAAMAAITLHVSLGVARNRLAADAFLGPRLFAAPVDPARGGSGWCGTPPELRTIACFLMRTDRLEAARFLAGNTQPDERVFVGAMRHDKISANDIVIYFAADRLPATRWAHFDPGLQTSARVQNEIIGELRDRGVRFLVLSALWDDIREPNDSAKSSGVHLLDEYLRTRYSTVAWSESMALLVRKPE